MICFVNENGAATHAEVIVASFPFVPAEKARFALVLTEKQLELRSLEEPKLGAIFVDFASGALAHRRQFGGGRGEAIAKAVGVKGAYLPKVLDATAGLGRDAFVLASIGCQVTLLERHPVVFLLLQNGLMRAYQDPEIGEWLKSHLSLYGKFNIAELTDFSQDIDVVYLDPMYPHRQKSALVKKEMRIFQHIVGKDEDASTLLEPARKLAKKRVVVKRPQYAEFLGNVSPHVSIETKKHRFDIYNPIK